MTPRSEMTRSIFSGKLPLLTHRSSLQAARGSSGGSRRMAGSWAPPAVGLAGRGRAPSSSSGDSGTFGNICAARVLTSLRCRETSAQTRAGVCTSRGGTGSSVVLRL